MAAHCSSPPPSSKCSAVNIYQQSTPPFLLCLVFYNYTCKHYILHRLYKFTCGYATCTPSAERLEARSWEPRYSCTSRTLQPISGANEDPSSPFLRQPWLLSPQLLLRSLFSGASNSETLAGLHETGLGLRDTALPGVCHKTTKPAKFGRFP